MSMQVKQSILKIHPYKQGESEVNGVKATIKLSSNESTLGPSPRAKAAFIKAAQELNRYPDGGQTELRKAIAEAYQLPADQIVCGNGSEELIQLLIRAYCSEGDEVLMSENGFVMCKIHSLAQGAVPVFAPEKNDCIDVDALLQRVSSKTRMVIIANPNNPTGTYVTRSEVERLHAGLRDDILLLLDGAYAEYVSREDYTAGSSLVQDGNRHEIGLWEHRSNRVLHHLLYQSNLHSNENTGLRMVFHLVSKIDTACLYLPTPTKPIPRCSVVSTQRCAKEFGSVGLAIAASNDVHQMRL